MILSKRRSMIRYFKILLITASVLLLTVPLCGCADSMDINDKWIATTIALDKKDGEIYFYVEVANIEASQGTEAGSGSTASKYILVKGHGKTLPEARENMDRLFEHPIFLSGMRTLLLTERFAEEELVEYLYRVRTDETYRKKVVTVITRDELDDLFTAFHDKDVSLGYSIEHTIEALDESGESFSRTTSRLLENIARTYTGILMPCIGLHDNLTELAGYSVVSGTKVTGFIPMKESKGLVMLKADKAKSNFIVPYNEFQFTIETTLKKRKFKAFYEDGKPSFVMKLEFDAKLMYGDKKLPYNLDDKAIEEINAKLKSMMEYEILTAIWQAQNEYITDYLQLDDAFRMKYPVEFETMDWQEEFINAKISVDLKVDLSFTYMVDYGEYETR